MVVTECTLTHILQMLLQNSTLLWVTKVLHLTMLVYSTAHMCRFKWFVQLVRILSNQRLVSKQDTVLPRTHSQPLMQQMLHLVQMITSTTEECKWSTLCNNKSWVNQPLKRGNFFFYANFIFRTV